MGKLTKDVRLFEDVRTAEWTSLVMIGRSFSFGLRTVFAAGPAGCVDWTRFMRGAAALAYLSPQDITLRFDWMEEQIRNSPKVIFLLTITKSVLDRSKSPRAFNDLRFVVHEKA